MLRSFFLCLAVAACAFAQSTQATLVGRVVDSTDAAVVGAGVKVVETSTGFTSNTVTANTGEYYLPYLNPGTYRLTISANGFKEYVQDGVVLRTDEKPRIDVKLEVGNLSEAITVTAAPPLLETETSTSGQILEGATITNIPVLAKYLPAAMLYYPGLEGTGVNAMHAVGERTRAMDYTMDGLTAKEPGRFSLGTTNRVASTTNDAWEEVKVSTTGLPAEYGHAAGGLLSVVFKTGTNEIHGSAEDRYLNRDLLHRAYFDQVQPPPENYHEMTATLGGPLYLPKIYNGKNKTFFFLGFQRHNEVSSSTFTGDVPTPAMLNGDFSFGGLGNPIYDPTTTRQDASGNWVSDPFPQNQIPTSRFDPVAQKFLSYKPFTLPNTVGFTDNLGVHNNLVEGNYYQSFRTRWDIKIDHQFSPLHHVFGRYSQVRNRSYNGNTNVAINWPLIDPNLVPIPIDQINGVISDTYTISPTMVNEARIGFNRRHYTSDPDSLGQGWAEKLGIPNVGSATFP